MDSDSPITQTQFEAALAEVGRGGITRDTYTALFQGAQLIQADNGRAVIGVSSDYAQTNLSQKPKAAAPLVRALKTITGHDITLEFVTLTADHPAPAELAQAEGDTQAGLSEEAAAPPLTAAEKVAAANHYSAFFAEKGGTGYTQFSNYAIRFYTPLLKDKGFGLLTFLISSDQRPVKTAPGWTEPVTYNLADLTAELGKSHHRYIGGEEKECEYSRQQRAIGKPLMSEADCCGGFNYPRLRFKEHPKPGCGLMCKYWFMGALQLLDTHGLVTVEFETPTAYNFQVQVWRRLHLLTPHQHEQLPTAALRKAHKAWVEKNGLKHFGVTYDEWLTITEPIIYPLMAGYDQRLIQHNLASRYVWQEFFKNSRLNPNYGQPKRRRK